jgi:hypothetical protein
MKDLPYELIEMTADFLPVKDVYILSNALLTPLIRKPKDGEICIIPVDFFIKGVICELNNEDPIDYTDPRVGDFEIMDETNWTKRKIKFDTIFLYDNKSCTGDSIINIDLEFNNVKGWECVSPLYKQLNRYIKVEYNKKVEINCLEECITCIQMRNGPCRCIETKIQINYEYIY